MEQPQTEYTTALNADRTFISKAESEVKEFLANYAAAIRKGDLEAIMACYAEDVIAFDMIPPLEYHGRNEYRVPQEKYFTSYFQFPVEYNFKQQMITVGGDVAFAHSLIHMAGKNQRGEKMDMWMRHTAGLKKLGELWLIVHEHNSVPLDGKTGKGMTDLKPERSVH